MQTTINKAAKLRQFQAERVKWRQLAGAVICASRMQKKLSQERLAEAIGRTQSWLTKAEKGERKIENGDLIMIARALGIRMQVMQERILRWEG